MANPLRNVQPMMSLSDKQAAASGWFRQLRNDICTAFEAAEADLGGEGAAGKFQRTPWNHPQGGGGEMSVMKGRVFEKVGVNISTVHGEFSEQFRKEIPGAAADPRFWASGISLVAHMCSPKAPAAHFNTRMICVGGGDGRVAQGELAPSANRIWFGGGGDLNPMVAVEKDTQDFHGAFKAACDGSDAAFYPSF